MDNEPKSLLTKGKSNNLGKLCGKWKAKKSGASISIEIYEKGLLQISSEGSCKSIEYDFDLKFSFDRDLLEFKFERGKDTVTYILAQLSDLQQWRTLARAKINQRGFHQQFKPIKKIGKGNFASVYLAQKLEDGQNYAVKAFSKEAAYSEENGKECLIKEIEVMRCLEHPNNMKLHQVFESQNSLYIIFQLLSGGQLYDKVKSKYKFKPRQIQATMFGILKGLKQMHSKSIMHRDLKPQNLLFRKEGDWDCVIADFGLAQFANIDTYLFVRCGTPGYVAPEVINIKDMSTKYHPICDLYSLGLIFHILLFGKSAFPGKTYNQVLSQNRAANIDFSGSQYQKLNSSEPHTFELLVQLLNKRPNERISAEKALSHPYFTLNYTENPLIPEEVETKPTLQKKQSNNDYVELNSPLLTSANAKRKEDRTLKKDSCVDFQMGKQNMLTGKTEEVADSLRSNKISIANTSSTPSRKPKQSKFNQKN